MKKVLLAAALGLILASCDDGPERSGTYEDTPPTDEGRPPQDVDRQPDRPDGGATGT